jgi:iron uptake system component EfeO
MKRVRRAHERRRGSAGMATSAAAALAALGALSACTSGTSATTSALSVTVSRGSCGGTWQASGGLRTFQVHNVDIVTTEVDLIDPATGGVYAEVESLAPNATRPMQVQLGHGRYAFRCYPEDTDALNGPTVRITTGEATGSSAVLPLSGVDLAPASPRSRPKSRHWTPP